MSPARRKKIIITLAIFGGGFLWLAVGGASEGFWEKLKSYLPGIVEESTSLSLSTNPASAEDGLEVLTSNETTEDPESSPNQQISTFLPAVLTPDRRPTAQESGSQSETQIIPEFVGGGVLDPITQDTNHVNESPPIETKSVTTQSSGNISNGTPSPIIPDQDGAEIKSISASINNKILSTSVVATDETGVAEYDIQFIVSEFVDDLPEIFCANQTEEITPATNATTWGVVELFTQVSVTPCNWFTYTDSTNANNFALSTDLSTFSYVVRARARDILGNLGEWKYSDVIFSDDDSTISGTVVISEIAWMGTTASAFDEWIELFNAGNQDQSLLGWKLVWGDYSTSTETYEREIDLSSTTIKSYQTLILERTDDTTISDIVADLIYTGPLGNSGEHIRLINLQNKIVDEIDASSGWPAGDNRTKETMGRIDFFATGYNANNWCTFLSCSDTGLLYAEKNGQDANFSPLNASANRPFFQ
jgi:hypothetical protein